MNHTTNFSLLIGVILVIFLVFLVVGTDTSVERFINPEDLVLYQGATLPLDGSGVSGYSPVYQDTLPTVDGEKGSNRSMFSFSYNECKPECCKTSPYSCDRGCICIDPKQYEFIGSRGYNNRMGDSCKKRGDEKTKSLGFFDPAPVDKANIW